MIKARSTIDGICLDAWGLGELADKEMKLCKPSEGNTKEFSPAEDLLSRAQKTVTLSIQGSDALYVCNEYNIHIYINICTYIYME